VLFGHDESLPHGDDGAGENRAGDAFFEARSKIIYSQPNMGAGVGFLQSRRVRKRAGALARWSGEGQTETVRVILLVRNGAYAWLESQSGSAAIAANINKHLTGWKKSTAK